MSIIALLYATKRIYEQTKKFEEKQEFFTTLQEMYHKGGFNTAGVYYILGSYAPGITNDVGYMSHMLFVPPTRYFTMINFLNTHAFELSKNEVLEEKLSSSQIMENSEKSKKNL